MTNEQWVLRARPEGLPKASDWEWRTGEVAEPGEGEVVVRTVYLSLDPAMRGWMSHDTYVPAVELGAVMRGGGVGVVEASRHPKFAAGDLVQGMVGWQKYAVLDGKTLLKLPELPVPLGARLGLLGHIGFTAYFGLLDVGAPKEGETLVVSAAAGAVGSLVGQIGKIKGCRVVGIAGSDEKCEWIVKELGFDGAINYKKDDLKKKLRELCPAGIDVYFENVGGRTLEVVLDQMNLFGRIAVCGMISGYNATEREAGPGNLFQLNVKRLKMQGFLVTDYMPRAAEAVRDLVEWYGQGKMKYRLDVTEGLENAPGAFLKLFDGSNQGKVVVRVSPES